MIEKVEPVTFKNSDGLQLFGIMHSPEHPRTDIGIIFLCPGIKNRVAPHRLYVKMSTRFAAMGFNVLRFDPHGIGDSEGEVQEESAAMYYSSIQAGRYVSDTRSAMDWFESNHGISTFILAGLCGGAITGLLTGAADSRAISLLGLGIPVIFDTGDAGRYRYMTNGQLDSIRNTYFEKLSNAGAWIRLLSFKSDFRLIFRSLSAAAKEKIRKPRQKDESPGEPTVIKIAGDNRNPYFAPSLHKMLVSRKVLLIFSENDRLYWEFDEKYMASNRKDFERLSDNIEVHVIKNANHIFSFKQWQEEMIGISREWLERNFHSPSMRSFG